MIKAEFKERIEFFIELPHVFTEGGTIYFLTPNEAQELIQKVSHALQECDMKREFEHDRIAQIEG